MNVGKQLTRLYKKDLKMTDDETTSQRGSTYLSYRLWFLAHSVGVHGQYGVPGTQVQHARGTVQEESAEVGRVLEHIWAQDLRICTPKQR